MNSAECCWFMCAKVISEEQIIGEQGVNLIQRRVLQMGWLWHGRGAVEAGIDGTIEVRDPKTGEAFNLILMVQSKATLKLWEAESDSSFIFRPRSRDVEYWLRGNAPVILIVSRPHSDEAYWVNIKEYHQRHGQATKITFDKFTCRFDLNAREELLRQTTREGGFCQPPLPVDETLWSNLLAVDQLPQCVYEAVTPHRDIKALCDALPPSDERFGVECVPKGGKLLSFKDLSRPPWDRLCDVDTVQSKPTEQWCDLDDPDRTRTFVRLLNRHLSERLYQAGVRFYKKGGYYYFQASGDLEPMKVSYTRRDGVVGAHTVFNRYGSKKGDVISEFFRHAAFSGRFVFYEPQWYLQITPTYHYTWNGRRPYPGARKLLAGAKRLERNDRVRSQVMVWADFIARSGPLVAGTDCIKFGSLLQYSFPYGIKDAQWLKHEAQDDGAEENGANASDPDELTLFGRDDDEA